MNLQNDEQSKHLFHSQAHIWNHIFSFIKSMSLKCAVQLQIPDIIDRYGAPMPLPELVKALSINPERSHFVYRLMRILVHSGFFTTHGISCISTVKENGKREPEEGYSLTEVSCLLLKEHPFSVRPFLFGMLDPIMIDPWQNMTKWLENENDATPFQTTYGKSFWEFAAQKPDLNRIFNEAMASDATFVANVIVKECSGVFEGLNTLVDVGGGIGTIAKAISKTFGNVNCICFDLPQVVNGLEGDKNLSYVGGDMFEGIPKGDAILLKWILHDWNDEDCKKILKRCKEAIPSKENGGKLIIIDMVVKNREEGDASLETQLFFDMLMMTLASGRERDEKDWAKLLLNDAGFSDYKITHIFGLRSLIEVYP